MPLTDAQTKTIKATVPVVKVCQTSTTKIPRPGLTLSFQEHGAAITKEFYGTLLHDVPDLNNLFK